MDPPGRGGKAAPGTDPGGERVGGEPACLMHRLCPECWRLADENPPTRCPHCGTAINDG